MITKEEIYDKASMYLIRNVGNLIGPGEPAFDGKVKVWRVPIFHMSKVAKFLMGEMLIGPNGEIVHVPTVEQLIKHGEKIELKM